MAKIVWDETGKRFYETGVSHGVLYLYNSKEKKYGTGVPWNGLTAVTESPSGAEANDIYADDIKYASLRSAETFGATIEAYTYPDEFTKCDGSVEIENAKGVYLGQQARETFGFVYRSKIGNDTASEEDDGYKLHLIYGATASPSEKAYSTINDSPEAITFSWEISTIPIEVNGYKPISTITIDSTKADKIKLAELEKKLFGDDSEGTPTLPFPAEVIETMTSEAV